MRWVNDTLPPRARARWLLITIRLSMSSLTGTERTLVAVGTARLASMFCAVRAGAPRRTVCFGASSTFGFSAGSGSFGTGGVVRWAGGAAFAGGALLCAAGVAWASAFEGWGLAGCAFEVCGFAVWAFAVWAFAVWAFEPWGAP